MKNYKHTIQYIQYNTMKYIIITICFILALNISEASSSSYMHGFSVGLIKNRMARKRMERRKYEEMNHAVCKEPNPSHNPFIVVEAKDPMKCYDDEKPLNPAVMFLISLVLMACLITISPKDQNSLDFIIGMIMADMLEDIFEK